MRISIKQLIFPLVSIALSSQSFASVDCMDTAVTQTDMNICAGKEYDEADAKLNKVYNALQKKYQDERLFLANLKKAQQAWIKFRDAEVEAHFPLAPGANPTFEYGTMYDTTSTALKTTLTQERVKQLSVLLELGFGNN